MKENRIIDFMIGKNNVFSRIMFYLKLKREIVTYDTLCEYYDFLNCLQRMFFCSDDIINTVNSKEGDIYIILTTKYYTAYISPKPDNDLSIRIFRSESKIDSRILFNYDEYDKVTRYDRYIIDKVLAEVKSNILRLFAKYI